MQENQFILDGRTISFAPGQSILEAALDAGVFIPHLCSHPDLPPSGACGMCVVECDGETLRSCATPAKSGMQVISQSVGLSEIRTVSMQLMLASHIDDCNSCPKYLKCELQSLIQQQGTSTGSYRKSSRIIAQDEHNPLIIRDMERCVACGRCVRVCSEIRKVGALTYRSDTNGRKYVVTKADDLRASDCRFCGACVEVCPTGALRDKDDVFAERFAKGDMLVPCAYECPAHLDIPAYLRFLRRGENEQAMAKIMERVPFPQSLGNICMRFCESKCRRQYVDESVSVCALKRFAGVSADSTWRAMIPTPKLTGKRVAIVGAGPTGLTAAWFLKLKGHDVTVFEQQEEAGGMMRYGMPEYRLPLQELKADIETICSIGINLKINHTIERLSELNDYDTVLWCGGAPIGARLPLDGAESADVLTGMEFLRAIRLGQSPQIGKRVLVLGGGDVAYDCARSAIRLGAEAAVCCLEPENRMTSSDHERIDGAAEGVKAYPGRTFERIVTENGRVTGLSCCNVTKFSFDDAGKLKLEKDPASEHVIECDTIIFAVGQRVAIPEAMGMTVNAKGAAVIDENCRCGDRIFAAGDAVTGTSSVVQAVAWGQRAASAIDRFLGGNGEIIPILAAQQEKNPDIHENQYFNAARFAGAEMDAAARKGCFDAYVSVLKSDCAAQQAARCLQCDLRKEITRPKFYNEYTTAKKGGTV